MSVTNPDLINNFPDAADPNRLFRDVDLTTKSLVDQYYTYVNAGNFQAASQLILDNPVLNDIIISAYNMQYWYDMMLSQQRFYFTDFQKYVQEAIQFKGNWSSSAQYSTLNVVKYTDGFIYMAIKPNIPIGTLPTNINYFIPQTLKGDQGASGFGLSPRGAWNSNALYYVHDMVSYEGKLWYATLENMGSVPSEASSDWRFEPGITTVTGGQTDTASANVSSAGVITVNVKNQFSVSTF